MRKERLIEIQRHGDPDTGESRVPMEAAHGTVQLQAKEQQGLPAVVTRAGRGREGFFLEAYRGSMAIQTS